MNFVYADVKLSGDIAELSFANETIKCSGEHSKKLKKVDGKQIVLGIRPEAFEDSLYAKDSEYTESISIKVTLLEQLGSDSYIHFYKDLKPVQTEAIEEILADEGEDITVLGDETKFIARINPNSTVKEGEEINLSIDPSKLHFFDPESGNAL
jgi:multiple sugar transport system ATP-binding protein